MIVVLNNKCNFEKDDFELYLKRLNKIKSSNLMILCPSNIYLNNIKLKRIFLGSQNVSSEDDGPRTGEVSAKQLKSVGVQYCLVGHSERRLKNREYDEDINDKIKLLLKSGITPILCVGESLDEKKNYMTKKVIKSEIEKALDKIKVKEKVIIAYEPIWAIGTGKTPTLEEIENIISYIKELFPNNTVIYGGSVNEKNILSLKSNLINGYLLGEVSLDTLKIQKIIDNI